MRTHDAVVPEDGDFEFGWEGDGSPWEGDKVVVFHPGFIPEVGGHEDIKTSAGG